METFNPYDSAKLHAYEVEMERGDVIVTVKVFANNRSEAARIVGAFGWVVRSMGMAG